MQKRNKSIKIRVSDEEHQRLLALAQNKPLAEFMREYCLSADSEYYGTQLLCFDEAFA